MKQQDPHLRANRLAERTFKAIFDLVGDAKGQTVIISQMIAVLNKRAKEKKQ